MASGVSSEESVTAEEQKLALRIKSKKSQNAVLRDVSTKGTIDAFLDRVAELTGIENSKIVLLTGFPPRRIEFDRSEVIETLGLSNQDTLIVEAESEATKNTPAVKPTESEEAMRLFGINIHDYVLAGHEPWKRPERTRPAPKTETPRETAEDDVSPSTSSKKNQLIINALNSSTVKEAGEAAAKSTPAKVESSPKATPVSTSLLAETLLSGTGHVSSAGSASLTATNGMILRHVVPADNSCLFSSIAFCLTADATSDGSTAAGMRGLIADKVASEPERFTEAMLGRPNAEYVTWILKNESWGGGIELSILSEHYGLEIDVVDIQSLHISKFGEDKNYYRRIMLLYDGIHYDALYLDPFDGKEIQTMFSTLQTDVLDKAIQLGREAKAAHQFTDLGNFSLRCGICNKLLKGQTEAQAHAKTTGHTNFAEIVIKSS